MKAKDRCTAEQAELLEDFRRRARRHGFEFFALVGDPATGTGASVFGTVEASPVDSAARHARQAHVEWERLNGIDPEHSRDSADGVHIAEPDATENR